MSQKKQALTIRELAGNADWKTLYPLIKTLNKGMTKKTYAALLEEMLQRGYRCIGAYEGEKLVGACGFWMGYRFWCGKYIDLDNVVVDEKLRSRGIGKKLIAWVEKEARRLKCDQLGLDSYSTAYSAHRFYFREGYSILGYHFTKKL